MKKYCSSENYFSIEEIDRMMYTGLIGLHVHFEVHHRYRLVVYLQKDWSNPPDGFPNSVSVCLGQTRSLSKLPSKFFPNVRGFVLLNECLKAYLGV